MAASVQLRNATTAHISYLLDFLLSTSLYPVRKMNRFGYTIYQRLGMFEAKRKPSTSTPLVPLNEPPFFFSSWLKHSQIETTFTSCFNVTTISLMKIAGSRLELPSAIINMLNQVVLVAWQRNTSSSLLSFCLILSCLLHLIFSSLVFFYVAICIEEVISNHTFATRSHPSHFQY